MNQQQHAAQITNRFKGMVEASGDRLSEEHFEELKLLIGAGLDSALVDAMEKFARQLEAMAKKIRQETESSEI